MAIALEERKRRTLVIGLSLLLVASLFASLSPGRAAAAPVSVLNGIQFKDTSGNPLHAHGGGMIKVGSYYYWVGENRDGTNYVSL